MDDIAAYDPQKGSQIAQAFEELKKPAADPQSCLRIAKAYMYWERLSLERKHENVKGSLIRWLVVEALHTNPPLFGPHVHELQTYFDQLLTRETAHELERRREADAFLSTLQQGETFRELNMSQLEALSRLQAHKPLVISMAFAGLGDTLLMTPVIEDLSKVLKLIGSESKIRYLIKRFLVDIVRSMLHGCDNVEVILYNYSFTSIYLAYLASLGVENKVEVLHDEERKPYMHAIPAYEEQAGVILGWEKSGQNFSFEQFLKGTVYEKLGGMVSRVQLADNSDKNSGNSFRRCTQRGISYILGLKIFDTATRDDITKVSQGAEKFLEKYVTTRDSEEVRATLRKLQEQPGFENGYICVVSQGTTDIKRITPGLADVIANELEDICRQNQLGIVFIRSGNKDDAEEKESKLIAAHFLACGIPIYDFQITDRIDDTLVLLQSARGVIGPDTFLTHASEYFQDKPVLNCFADSARRVYRVDDRVIAVQHPIAKRAEENFRNFIRDISELYTREIIHPFAPLLTIDEQTRFHPLIKEAQKFLLQEVKSGLFEFKQRIIRANTSTGCP